MRVKVSVIMPSLNVVNYIEECINSALNQTLDNIEIICIDAGSTDGTWEILKKYEELSNENISIQIVHSDIRSYGYQVNLGIKFANGKYIAVLETDDYIDKDMYKLLFDLGEKNDCDFVKADFDTFCVVRNDEKWFNRISLFDKNSELYNRVINPSQNDFLYAHDYNIWKGIYKKSFLVENNIWLNESAGAAYQDIGFAQQVLACAKRTYYTDLSLYRYRTDRDESSVNSFNGLRYSKQEFQRLLENEEIKDKLVCQQGLYRHMAQSFMGEYSKILRAVDYDVESEHLANYYSWFKENILNAIKESRFDLTALPEDFKDNIQLLLRNCQAFSDKLKQEYNSQKERERSILDKIQGREIVVFGAGIRGDSFIRFVLKNDIEPIYIFDNNENLWGTYLYGIQIKAPFKPDGEVMVIIANKHYSEQIKEQIVEIGIQEDKIFILQE